MGASAAMAGTVLQGVSKYQDQAFQADMLRADADAERSTAAQQAKRILSATERQRAAARAATAASGTRIDDMSLMNEQDIIAAGETDAGLTIIGGERNARMLETKAKMHKAAGYSALGASLFSAADQYKNWKGAKGRVGNDESGMTYSRTGEDIRARR